MTITLPDEMRAEVEAKAKAAGLSVDAYFLQLFLEDDAEVGDIDLWDPAVRQRLMAAAEEGLRSPPLADSEAFLAELTRVANGGRFEDPHA